MLKLAFCNFISDPNYLKPLALENGFEGIDWTLKLEDLPRDTREEARFIDQVAELKPLEVRFHLAYAGVDLGNVNKQEAQEAGKILRRSLELIARADAEFATIHIGLGSNSTGAMHWEWTLEALSDLVQFAGRLGIRLCLENLAWGWTSRPELFEKLIRKTGAGVTLDLGHARVSPWVRSHHFSIEDFIHPHPEKIFNAHIYHEEGPAGHTPPDSLADIEPRLNLLKRLPCDWWVLELHNENDLLATLKAVRDYPSSGALFLKSE